MNKQSRADVENYTHAEAKRKNIPTAENQVLVPDEEKAVRTLRYQRNPDLDPQLLWRGKDEENGRDLEVQAPPVYIQEKIHPRVLIEDLKRRSAKPTEPQIDLFHDFNGLPEGESRTEFYAHDQNWSNRMILGDSLLVMGSLAERERLRGQVQAIYFDPPYGIKFNSNWQPSTKSRDVKDGKVESTSREPEVIKAFRDTWSDKVNSYLSYLRDRLAAARDLLTESGSIFVQIGDENVHLLRSILDEIFGRDNFVSQIVLSKTAGATSDLLPPIADYILWYSRKKDSVKFRQPYLVKSGAESGAGEYKYLLLPDGTLRPMSRAEREGEQPLPAGARLYRPSATTSQRPPGSDPFEYQGRTYRPSASQFWKTHIAGLTRLGRAGRLIPRDKSISYLRLLSKISRSWR